MTHGTKSTLNELLHPSRRNRVTVGGGASTADITAEVRWLADPDLQDELPRRRHVAGALHNLNQLFREAFIDRDEDDSDERAG